jgi:hypothetical protein
MTTQGRRRRPDLSEGTPERDPSGRTARPQSGGGGSNGKGKQKRPTLEPMVVNESKIIWIGIAVWAAAFVILLPFRKTLIADGHGWWLYTCLAGAGLGMMGLPLVRRRKHVMEQEIEHGANRAPRSSSAPSSSRPPRRR